MSQRPLATALLAILSVVPSISYAQDLRALPKPESRTRSLADCPIDLTCHFVPAAYEQTSATNPAVYGNYDIANRPVDMPIRYIVLHDAEGSYSGTIAHFKNPKSNVSAHYVIRSSDGDVTQMVDNKNVAWHAGNWYMNMHSIGIEHEGFAINGTTWYSDAMYRSSAKLVRHLARRYGIPLDRQHILGHNEYQGPTGSSIRGMHWDPGPYWNWEYYMELLNMSEDRFNRLNEQAVTIVPPFSDNKPAVQGQPSLSTNFVYLYSAPDETSPLLSDPFFNGGGPSSNRASDQSAKVFYGQSYGLAERQNDWLAIWYGGKKGWLKNPASAPIAITAPAKLVKPKDGLSSIPVYGRAYPEASAYPSFIPKESVIGLGYSILAGQTYTVSGPVQGDYFYAPTINLSRPGDHMVVIGSEAYYQITFNSRQAFVKASDIEFVD